MKEMFNEIWEDLQRVRQIGGQHRQLADEADATVRRIESRLQTLYHAFPLLVPPPTPVGQGKMLEFKAMADAYSSYAMSTKVSRFGSLAAVEALYPHQVIIPDQYFFVRLGQPLPVIHELLAGNPAFEKVDVSEASWSKRQFYRYTAERWPHFGTGGIEGDS